ncbi:MAG: hypothetical protein PWQ19_208 [Tepidiphilus sp.]|nr:hypothetical protein [Tepidiphilus sp.]
MRRAFHRDETPPSNVVRNPTTGNRRNQTVRGAMEYQNGHSESEQGGAKVYLL